MLTIAHISSADGGLPRRVGQRCPVLPSAFLGRQEQPFPCATIGTWEGISFPEAGLTFYGQCRRSFAKASVAFTFFSLLFDVFSAYWSGFRI